MIKKFAKGSIFLAILAFILAISGFSLITSVRGESLLWLDEFTNSNPRWEWSYHLGTGYHLPTMIEGLSVAELGITTQSTNQAYSDSSLHEYGYLHENGIVEMRLRYEGNNKMGTMGWGVWNYENPANAHAAWFLKATPDGNPIPLQAMVYKNSAISFQQSLPTIDIYNWHTYRVEFSSTGTQFLVDGNIVAQTAEKPDFPQRIELWVDNYLLDGTQLMPIGYMTIAQDQKLYFDWVSFANFDSPTPIICSANADGQNGININDFKLVFANWGKTSGFGSADLNGDSKVNGLDLAKVINEWGKTCP